MPSSKTAVHNNPLDIHPPPTSPIGVAIAVAHLATEYTSYLLVGLHLDPNTGRQICSVDVKAGKTDDIHTMLDFLADVALPPDPDGFPDVGDEEPEPEAKVL